jgi:hypothetical protein
VLTAAVLAVAGPDVILAGRGGGNGEQDDQADHDRE